MSDVFDAADLTDDAFLCGKLHLLQPRRGYRAATDPVLLAACVDAKPGQHVLDLGCGAGAATLCLANRIPGLVHAGLELQPAYADLARQNAARNGVTMEVIEGDVTEIPAVLRREFHHVIANPPYYPPGGTPSPDTGRATALQVATPITARVASALRRLAPGGHLTMILSVDLLPAALTLAPQPTLLPLAPRENRPAPRAILQVRKLG
ncbi:MAG: tRNA1(Val) (adenine(37)-N6)-methyltransferase, partial [Paracoccaceae bacterium]